MDVSTPRTVQMQVLILSMPRSGTASIKSALEMLGYGHVFHGYDLVRDAEQSLAWEKAVDAKIRGTTLTRETFDALLGHCEAVTDTPPAFLAEDLIAAYPEAKVILIERDIHKWTASILPLLHSILGRKGVLGTLHDRVMGPTAQPRVFKKIYLYYFRANDYAEAVQNLEPVYRDHYAKIRRLVPRRRLLNYNIAAGWKPLCDFLGKKKPPLDFPWEDVNPAAGAGAGATRQTTMESLMTRERLFAVMRVALPLSVLFLGFFASKILLSVMY